MEKAHGLIKLAALAVLCTLCGMFAYDLGWQQGGERAAQMRELSAPTPFARTSDGPGGGGPRYRGGRYGHERYEPAYEATGGETESPSAGPSPANATPASRGLPGKR
ncbi:MAG TPA: hypothetical protein VF796_14685 [Humisphaera sp.]